MISFLELNPLYIIRYEDLVFDPKTAYEDIFKFLLDLDDISGTNIQRRINEVVEMGVKA